MSVRLVPVAATHLGELGVDRGDLSVGAGDVGDELHRQRPAGPTGNVPGTDGREQGLAAFAVRSLPAPEGISSASSWCSRFTVAALRATSSVRQSDSSRSAAVSSSIPTSCRPGVRSATTATVRAAAGSFLPPCPIAKIRARVDSFTGTSITVVVPVAEQPLRQVRADASRALHRPPTVRPLPAKREQLPVPVAVVHHLQADQLTLPFVDHRHHVRPLRRIHPEHHRDHDQLRPHQREDGAGQTYLQRSRPPLSHTTADCAMTGGSTPLKSHSRGRASA